MAGPVVTLVETALSSVSGPSSSVVELAYMSAAERAPILRAMSASSFFKHLPYDTARWIERIRYLRVMNPVYLDKLAAMNANNVAFHSAVGKMAAQEAAVTHAARIAAANAAASAAEGTLVAGAGTTVAAVVIPVVAMVAVQVALGAGYYQAREKAKKDEFVSGFARGFIIGLLKWELRFTIDRFWDNAVARDSWDEAMPTIRAQAHNEGLIAGRVAGLAKSDAEKQVYLKWLTKVSDASTAGWTSRSDNWNERMRARRVQLNYVIEMAVAARKLGLVIAE